MEKAGSGPPKHKPPMTYEYEGMFLFDIFNPKKTVEMLAQGQGPEFEVLVATHPRSGTARLLEIVWLILHDLDFETSRTTPITQRQAFLEACDPTFTTQHGPKATPIPKPLRVAKSHFRYDLMKKQVDRPGVKVIVGLRNPKDCLVSFYHMFSKIKFVDFKGSFEQFFDEEMKGNTASASRQVASYGDMFDFYTSWWNQRHRENILFTHYEDMNENPEEEIQKIAKFLGKDVTKEQIRAIMRWTLFDNMKKEDALNHDKCFGDMFKADDGYMRKGKVGEWKNTFTEEQSKFVDEKYAKRCLPLGLEFKFE